jgi:hypothetical protein
MPLSFARLENALSAELADLIAKRFIARSDAKAKQGTDGGYFPVVVDPKRDRTPIKWSRDDVINHLDGRETFGHYMIDPKDNTCKLFALDIDLTESGLLPTVVHPYEDPEIAATVDDQPLYYWEDSFKVGNPREAWRDRHHPARNWIKLQFHYLAHKLVRAISQDLSLPCAVAYSGNKGIHVYAFTGRIPAADARGGALIALDLVGGFTEQKGRASTYHSPQYSHLSVEVYPKQDTVSNEGFGNLMRLPLGINQKAPKDPTFFIDMTGSMASFSPTDPLWALGEGADKPYTDPW